MPTLEQSIDQLDNVSGQHLVTNFAAGLNVTKTNELLLDSEAIIRKNWAQTELGAIEKVTGFTKANSSAIASAVITGLFRVYQSDGTTKGLAVCNGTLYYSNDDFANLTAATSGTGLSTTAFNTGVNYNNLFFFTNSTNNLKTYTPSTNTMAAATNTPTYACKILFKRSDRRLIALVNATFGSTLYFSKIDPTGAASDDWSATNDAGSIAIDGTKSDPLTGGMPFGPFDIIFKDNRAFKVWCYPDVKAEPLKGSPGCVAPYSVAQGDGMGFFLAQDGVYMFNGATFVKISEPVESIINGINSSYIGNVFGVYRNRRYWLFYSDGSDTTNQDCLIYDVEHSNPYAQQNIWFERDDLDMNCPVVFDGTTDVNELYASSSAADGFIYRLDYSATGADDTSDITAVYQTKYFDMGTPYLVKAFPKVYIRFYCTEGDFTVNWYTDRGSTTDSYTISDTSGESTHVQRLPDTAVGKDISIKITHADTGTAPIIRSIKVDWEALYMA